MEPASSTSHQTGSSLVTRKDDLTRLDEILALHDFNLEPGAGSPQEFRERCVQTPIFELCIITCSTPKCWALC
jgi:hypothetical protein